MRRSTTHDCGPHFVTASALVKATKPVHPSLNASARGMTTSGKEKRCGAVVETKVVACESKVEESDRNKTKSRNKRSCKRYN